jgi:hypothetical chaperone protein
MLESIMSDLGDRKVRPGPHAAWDIPWGPSGVGCVGLDFGTTNSAVSIVAADGPRLAEYATAAGASDIFPSVLNFQRVTAPVGSRVQVSAGADAIERYLAEETRGRLIQSLKTCLADRRFDGTTIYNRPYRLEDLVSLLARHLLLQASATLGPVPRRAVIGRPVHFSTVHGHADDGFAATRLLEAVRACGFEEVVFEYEPVAAAYSYERTLDHDELILIGDFGGGTSDFCVLEVGPTARRRGRRSKDIHGTSGVAVAGDAFDRQIVRHLVAPRLGMDAQVFSPPDKRLPMPAWPYERLERWHHVSFLNNTADLAALDQLRRRARPADGLAALIHLVQDDLGYQLHESVRRTKFELSARETAEFRFRCGSVTITETVRREQFESWIRQELDMMAAGVDRLLASVNVPASAIDRVFLTGGSSFVPAVRRLLADRLGAEKITGGRELTSVATGLALRAAEEWPE